MDVSKYDHLKNLIISVLHLSKDATHIYIGFFSLIAAVVILRKPLTSSIVLLPGLLISFGIEVLDVLVDYLEAKPIRWAASVHDLMNTNLIPVLLVALAFWQRKNNRSLT
jgi:hypothetical protein